MAARIPGLGGLLTNPAIEQIFIWQILQQITYAILAPEVAALQEKVFSINRSLALSAAEAAAAVVKSHMTEAAGKDEAALSGINEERFKLLVQAIQNPPGVEALLELWRRGVIPEAGSGADSVSVEQGIREGQTGNKWIEPLKALKTALPSPESALEALLEGQTDAANARTLYEQWGGDPRYFDLMFNTRGSAPSPLEAAEMARRKIIPWEGEGAGVVSYRQAFLEGPWRNKWEVPYRALADYIPPPRTVTALVREGALTDAKALELFQASGLTAELAAVYLASAHKTKVAADHELAKSDVLTLYYDQLWDNPTATGALLGLGYSAENAAFLLDYTDFRRDKALLDKAVAKVASLYINHRIAKQAALDALDGLGLPTANRDHLLLTWERERDVNVKTLTAAELVAAVKNQLLTEAEAFAELQGQGYTARDAAIYMAIHGLGPPGGVPSA